MTAFLIIMAVFFAIIAVAMIIIKFLVIKYVIKTAMNEVRKETEKYPLVKDICSDFFEENISIKQIRNKAITATGKKVIKKVKEEINNNEAPE